MTIQMYMEYLTDAEPQPNEFMLESQISYLSNTLLAFTVELEDVCEVENEV